jgi:hypothetical protein
MTDSEIKDTVIEINRMILDLYVKQVAALRLLATVVSPGIVRDAIQSVQERMDNSLAGKNLLSQTDPKTLKESAELLRNLI